MDLVGGALTEELLCEVLKKLGVKSLLRLMCVSKRWCNLINDPYFVSSHLRFHKHSSSPDLQVVLRRNYQGFELFRFTQNPKTVSEHVKFLFPWNLMTPKGRPAVSILGHCNGVLCVREFSRNRPQYDSKATRLIIVNPITRRFLILPNSDTGIHCFPQLSDDVLGFTTFEDVGFGFGFVDDVSYKVVRGVSFIGLMPDGEQVCSRAREPSRVEVYYSRSASWRRVLVDIDLAYYIMSDGVFNPSDRCLYWIGKGYGERRGHIKFVSFDLVDEIWREILLPDMMLNDINFDDPWINYKLVRDKIVGESVAMFVEHQSGDHLIFRVWKMKKEKDKVSWTLAHTMNTNQSPIGFCRDGKHLVMTQCDRAGERTYLCLRDSKNMNDICFRSINLSYHEWTFYNTDNIVVADFVESLILNDGERGIIKDGCVRNIPHKSMERSEEDVVDISNLFAEGMQH